MSPISPSSPSGPSVEPAGVSARGRRDLAVLFGSGQRTVTVAAAATALGVSRGSAARRLAAWAAGGWLRRVRRGLYAAVPADARDPASWSEDPWYLADLVWDPCYIAGWSAASHWALTDQVFRCTIVATSQRVRRVDQSLAGVDSLVHHVGADRLGWGLVGEWRGDRRVKVSSPERTVADMLSDPALGGGIRHTMETLDALLSVARLEGLVDALEQLGNGAAIKRLGYLLEVLGYDTAPIKRSLTSGFPLLDPALPAKGARSSRWGLRINADVSA